MTLLFLISARTIRLENQDVNYVILAGCLISDIAILLIAGNWVQEILFS